MVVNSDGTVSVISETSESQSIGSPDIFNNASTSHNAAVYDTANDKVVIAYRDNGNSNYGTAIVGTVSGSSITFGTEVVFESNGASYVEAAYDVASGKVVIAYRDFSDSYGRAIVGTVSGTSISFGTKQVFSTTGSIEQISIVYAETQEKVVIAYRDSGTNGEAVVGTVSGTSISFGTVVEFYTGGSGDYAVVYNPTDSNVIIGFRQDNTTSGEAIVGTISGTSISFGSQNRFSENNINYTKGIYDVANQRVVFVYSDGTDGSKGKAVVGSISGDTITFGTEVVFNNASTTYPDVDYHVAGQKVVIVYTDETSSLNYGKFIVGTVSGTSITFGTAATFESASTDYSDLTYDSDTGQMVVAYRDLGGGNVGQTVVFQIDYTATNLTAENYIGMSRGVAIPNETGSKVSFESSTMGSEAIGAAYDSDTGKIILAYQDEGNSFYGTAVVGTVSGTSISFGTPVVFQSSKIKDCCAVYDTANQKVVITFCNEAATDAGTGIVGTVSGTSISFGSTATFDGNGANSPHSLVYDTNAGKVAIFYRDTSDSSKGKSAVGTVSGTSISWGSLVNFNGNNYTNTISAVYDSTAQKIVVSFRDVGESGYGSSVVGTISGTSISFGTKVVFSSSSTEDAFVTYDSSNNKSVVTYKDGGDSDKGKAAVGTVSGTSISFGTPVQFVSQLGSNYNCAYDAGAGSIIISYGVPLGQGRFITAKVSGTSIGSFSSPYSYYSDTNVVVRPQLIVDGGSGNAVVSFKDQNDSNKGSSTVTSFGFAGETADGNPASIDIIGSVSTNQGGLTAGEKYYVQTDGTISTTAGSPSVLAGTAISATKLVVKT